VILSFCLPILIAQLSAMMTSVIFLTLIFGCVVYFTFQNSYKKHSHKPIEQVAK